MNYRNDLDECLTYFKIFSGYAHYYLFGMPKLLSHFNKLLGRKVPRLLESYDNHVSSKIMRNVATATSI